MDTNVNGVDSTTEIADAMNLLKARVSIFFIRRKLRSSFDWNENMIMVTGNDPLLQTLVEYNKDNWWPATVRFIEKLAHVKDHKKHYWIARRSDGIFVSISCNHFLEGAGWGTIRKDDNGHMQICQVLPEDIEKILRKATYEALKQKALRTLHGGSV